MSLVDVINEPKASHLHYLSVCFFDQIKCLLQPPNSFFDITVDILEREYSQTLVSTKAHKTISLKCHALILQLNSKYFTNAYEFASGEKKDYTKIEVNAGQGMLAEKLIKSFYDPSLLDDLDVADILSIAGIADMLMCSNHLIHFINMVNLIEVDNFQTCLSLMDHVKHLRQRQSSELMNKLQATVETKCVYFLCCYFYPLEIMIEKCSDFLALEPHHLQPLLKNRLTLSESSLLTYLLEWFAFDESRWVESNASMYEAIFFERISSRLLIDHIKTVPFLRKVTIFKRLFSAALDVAREEEERSLRPVDHTKYAPIIEPWKPGESKAFGHRSVSVKLKRSKRSTEGSSDGSFAFLYVAQPDIFMVENGIKNHIKFRYCRRSQLLKHISVRSCLYFYGSSLRKYFSIKGISAIFGDGGTYYFPANHVLPDELELDVIVYHRDDVDCDCKSATCVVCMNNRLRLNLLFENLQFRDKTRDAKGRVMKS